MYVYKITNKINNKKYIGITNDPKKRWHNHQYSSRETAISRAIKKYGAGNFNFEVLYSGLSLEEAQKTEQELIKLYNTLTINGNGYNVTLGGEGIVLPKGQIRGLDNSQAALTEEQVVYIKSNRDKPIYRLYDEFSEIISYAQFYRVYHDLAFKEIKPTVECYPFNAEYSNQFTNGLSSFTPYEVEELRNMYAQGVHWKIAYQQYLDRCCEQHFWKIYTGRTYKYVKPEVFTEENKAKHGKSLGEKNPRSKLSAEQVIDIREMAKQSIPVKKIHEKYSMVSVTSIRDIINGKTWKHLL